MNVDVLISFTSRRVAKASKMSVILCEVQTEVRGKIQEIVQSSVSTKKNDVRSTTDPIYKTEPSGHTVT